MTPRGKRAHGRGVRTRGAALRHAERLLSAAADANQHGDPATAVTHLLAASRALESCGRNADAHNAREVAREIANAPVIS